MVVALGFAACNKQELPVKSGVRSYGWLHMDVEDAERERMLDEGKRRGDVAEAYLLSQLKSQGMVSD